MDDTCLYINGKVLLDGRFQQGLAVLTQGHVIAELREGGATAPAGARTIDLGGDFLAPGFIDTQVNGGGGVLFNAQPTVAGVRAIAEAHRPFGTTGLLPTLISDGLSVVRQALAAVECAIARGIPGVLGIHIEGPFLNGSRRGIHDELRLQQLTMDIADTLEPLSEGSTMLTLAPETVAPALIERLAEKGFIVCAGHSSATQEQARQALAHGLRGFTHLFNAMPPLSARAPGLVGEALVDPDSFAGIIVDGQHVSPVMLEIARRCKGRDRLMLVTDAMPPVGSAETEFLLQGKPVHVEGAVCLDADGTLAGTVLDMASAVRNMVRFTGCSLAEACTMASSTPAAFLGMADRRGAIRTGLEADMVVLDQDGNVRRTVISGVTCG